VAFPSSNLTVGVRGKHGTGYLPSPHPIIGNGGGVGLVLEVGDVD
jgi:hypothetical protein